MDSVLQVLFSHWYETHFNDKKMHIQEFLTVYNSIDEKNLDSVFDCIKVEAGASFQAGFKIAIQLLLGNQS